MQKQHFALIDMGSNSIRLVIYHIDHNGYYKEIHNMKIVARLSSHIQSNGELSQKGIDTLIDSLQHFQVITRAFDISNIKGVATAAIRQSVNQAAILKRIATETDYVFEVLSEYKEAYYGFLAVTNSTNIQDGVTIDIGGGSTELTLFRNRKLIQHHSFPFGAITLKQMFLDNDIPTTQELDSLNAFIQEQFQQLEWLNPYQLPVIGIGGSARNLSLIHQRKRNYPLGGLHQYEFAANDIDEIKLTLQEMPLDQRQQVEGLSKDRADIIIPAIHVIATLLKVVEAPTFIMSNKGLRDGIFYEELLSQLGIEQFPNVAEESFYQLSHEYEINVDHINQVVRLVTKLFYEIQKLNMFTLTPYDLQLLRQGAKVLYIGEYISREASSQHTFYLLTNQSIDGLTHIERLSIALIASFKSKSTFNKFISPYRHWFTKDEIKKLECLGAMLKLTYSLNRTRRNVINDLSLSFTEDQTLLFQIFYNDHAFFEEGLATKYKKHLEKALKRSIHLNFVKPSST